jgi:hypothetical protein
LFYRPSFPVHILICKTDLQDPGETATHEKADFYLGSQYALGAMKSGSQIIVSRLPRTGRGFALKESKT